MTRKILNAKIRFRSSLFMISPKRQFWLPTGGQLTVDAPSRRSAAPKHFPVGIDSPTSDALIGAEKSNLPCQVPILCEARTLIAHRLSQPYHTRMVRASIIEDNIYVGNVAAACGILLRLRKANIYMETFGAHCGNALNPREFLLFYIALMP